MPINPEFRPKPTGTRDVIFVNGCANYVGPEFCWAKALPKEEWAHESEEYCAMMEDLRETARVPRRVIDEGRRELVERFPILLEGDPNFEHNKIVELDELDEFLKYMDFEGKNKKKYTGVDQSESEEEDESEEENDINGYSPEPAPPGWTWENSIGGRLAAEYNKKLEERTRKRQEAERNKELLRSAPQETPSHAPEIVAALPSPPLPPSPTLGDMTRRAHQQANHPGLYKPGKKPGVDNQKENVLPGTSTQSGLPPSPCALTDRTKQIPQQNFLR